MGGAQSLFGLVTRRSQTRQRSVLRSLERESILKSCWLCFPLQNKIQDPSSPTCQLHTTGNGFIQQAENSAERSHRGSSHRLLLFWSISYHTKTAQWPTTATTTFSGKYFKGLHALHLVLHQSGH
ncbi:hypothetical protein Ae201684_006277 [Aphanomyces euteiches]|uniref:Uncharacterized protein n=1 Tax=Aphanomyces euteiches TaxID=100861 RepID=A0A6G0XCC9_9STRA|nr:hypothetical protein Ae201684_006277 [Aphanomyces euteiches]